ncbi:uncharacterized protein LOC119103663 [Pollicipes pollicipes]|uniref:uncharacterized protein LOC119103663 n=1 Tax=Pollicipes pollicipes TaxID=41117 RepID=UPI00188497AA|nr:uncharacterized protein LOC119103663 [Pollicipes pollicipes]XP_037083175.1 uncharacterized protein LOC119103663 [Pollicipes pollicipes]
MNGSASGDDDWRQQQQPDPASNATVVFIYPTVSPETVWVPIVCCIAAFPALVLTIVMLLRHRAMRARARSRITRKREAVRYTQAANKYCKVKLQNYDGLETVEGRDRDAQLTGTRMNGSYTISTDLATAVDRSEVTDGDASTFDIAGIVAGGGRRAGRLAASGTDEDIASGCSSQEWDEPDASPEAAVSGRAARHQ